MTPAITVALNTFRENRRDRVLYVLVIFALLMILAGIVVGELSPFEQAKILLDVGQAAMLLVGALIAIFLGIGLVSKEIERRTVYVIISKPVGRGEFLLGKVLGLTLTLSAALGIMSLMLAAVVVAYGGRPTIALAQSVALIWVELVLLVALSVTFATFTTTTLAAMFSLSSWVIGMSVGEFRLIGERAGGFSRDLLIALYWILPDLAVFDAKTRATYGVPLPAVDFALAFGYGAAWTAALLCIASVIFSRRDFR